MEAQLVKRELVCRGLNYRIRASRDLLTVYLIFPMAEITIDMSRLKAVELSVRSIFPPILLSLSSFGFLVWAWWFVGGGSWPVALDERYRALCSWAILGVILGVAATGFSWAFGTMRILARDNHIEIVVRMVPRRSGQKFVYSLRHMMQLG